MKPAIDRCAGILLLLYLLGAAGCSLPRQPLQALTPDVVQLTVGETAEDASPTAAQSLAQASEPARTLASAATSPTPPEIATPTQAAEPAQSNLQPLCAGSQCVYASPLWLSPPIQQPHNDQVDASYRFGSTQDKQRDPHHGVELLNPFGTPVLAAGDGRIVVAGDDKETRYSLYPNYYGNLVVIQHDLPAGSQADDQQFPGGALPVPIYTLYAHLSEISVREGQRVQAGEEIGRVGMTGAATGSHLHFEVRLGENTYQAARNPELWLAPHADSTGVQGGALAGRVLDAQGKPIQVEGVVIQYLGEDPDGPVLAETYLNAYEEKALLGLSPWGESFAVGDLPPGWYRVNFPYNGMQNQLAEVLPGQITVVTFQFAE